MNFSPNVDSSLILMQGPGVRRLTAETHQPESRVQPWCGQSSMAGYESAWHQLHRAETPSLLWECRKACAGLVLLEGTAKWEKR